MRRVLIGTPSYDGSVNVWFANSLLETIKMSSEKEIFIHAIYTSYDSLIQRARNSLFRIAIDQKYDDLFFIDSDVEWKAEDFFKILQRPEPIVGAALIKKKEDGLDYGIKLLDKNLNWSQDRKLIEVDGVGTGFLKISSFAFNKIWDISEPYISEDREERMICDLIIKNGDLISEDYVLCEKWKNLGYKVWIDPTIKLNHIGYKKYLGDFENFIKKLGYK